MCVLSYKKSRNGCKSIFHAQHCAGISKYALKNQEMVANAFFMNAIKKIIKHFAKKSFSVFKNAKNSTFEHTKTLVGKMFYYFFVTFMKNAFATIS